MSHQLDVLNTHFDDLKEQQKAFDNDLNEFDRK